MKRTKFLIFPLFLLCFLQANGSGSESGEVHFGPLIKKEERTSIVRNDNGAISAVDLEDGSGGSYHVEFILLEPDSLFLPVLLHSDMVFYVHTGKGSISWITGGETNNMYVERGDIYRIPMGSILYIRSQPDPMREKLRIHALFGSMKDDEKHEAFVGAYSNVTDLIIGFDEEVLKMGFKVSEEAIGKLKSAERSPQIIPYPHKNETSKSQEESEKSESHDWGGEMLETLIGSRALHLINKKKHKGSKTKAFNILKEKHDVQNDHGWSTAVTHKNLKVLKQSNIGVFMVNLTKSSMMGPHWNPMSTEISIIVEGEGMMQVVPPGSSTPPKRSNRFRVIEGDLFVVPRYHPMAQLSFDNGPLVFMGFTTIAKKNHPQYLAGSMSVFTALDRGILALSFNVPNTTVDEIFKANKDAIMLDCTSCAEEMEREIEEEIEREREEETRRREEEEEEARKREEEEEEQRRQEEEERRKQEEKERRQEEEERMQQEEEERRRQQEEEERRQQEEEERRRQEEERRQQEEEERRRQEEEERRRQEEERRQQEEEERRRQEEEERRRQEEERRQQEEEERRRQEEEERRQQEEEERRRQEEEERRQQEEEERRRQEEEEERRQQEEEERRRQEEEERSQRDEEERRRQEEKEKRQQEEEERRRQEEEEEERRQQEEEERRRQEEKEEEERRQQEEEEERRRQEEEARRQEEQAIREEEERQRMQEEEQARREEETRREEEEERQRQQEEEEEWQRLQEEEEEWERQQEEYGYGRREEEEGGGYRGGEGWRRLWALPGRVAWV